MGLLYPLQIPTTVKQPMSMITEEFRSESNSLGDLDKLPTNLAPTGGSLKMTLKEA